MAQRQQNRSVSSLGVRRWNGAVEEPEERRGGPGLNPSGSLTLGPHGGYNQDSRPRSSLGLRPSSSMSVRRGPSGPSALGGGQGYNAYSSQNHAQPHAYHLSPGMPARPNSAMGGSSDRVRRVASPTPSGLRAGGPPLRKSSTTSSTTSSSSTSSGQGGGAQPPRYRVDKTDPLDVRVAAVVNSAPLDVDVKRVGKGRYSFGGRVWFCKVDAGRSRDVVSVRVGGGWKELATVLLEVAIGVNGS
ncbi:hypothetical protein BJ684DRAFT_21015 [Piptocephalis cylindrospora]|uniref:GAR domain-containing protein n=1 Tax=Piptocephalis cylindrospora TaxID=1907219 RepID=A0A4P9Y2Z0_9FUNG|nr:hypothetical protein BJ684DRAFT_21015 [Piptocephalis cylindrospora]|eukprot:RKP12451.1 hypothetical protein BJ684DRAFT_21015 [Piptocephalis cylindrospora]